MVLHVLNRSPFASRVHEDMLRALGEDDRLLLIEDGVNGASVAGVALLPGLAGRLFALQEDLASRGMIDYCDTTVQVVDIKGFVALTEEADKVVSWF